MSIGIAKMPIITLTIIQVISFGHPDWDAMQNKHHLGRVPVEESATLHW